MKKTLLMFLLVQLLTSGIAGASLLDIGGGMIYDGTNELYWIQDTSMFRSQTYYNQITNINNLNSDSAWTSELWGDWHMAKLSDMEVLWSYSGDDIKSSFTNPHQSGSSWIFEGRYDEPGEWPKHTYFSFFSFYKVNGQIGDLSYIDISEIENSVAHRRLGAWVCASSTSPVPEPGTMILFGLGLLGFAKIFRNKLY